MTRLVRDFIQIEDRISLDRMIDVLTSVRDRLPEGAQDTRVQMRGDDLFGRQLSVSFLRPLNAEEAAREARYAEPTRLSIAA